MDYGWRKCGYRRPTSSQNRPLTNHKGHQGHKGPVLRGRSRSDQSTAAVHCYWSSLVMAHHHEHARDDAPGHSHAPPSVSGRAMATAVALTLLFVVVEALAGWFGH